MSRYWNQYSQKGAEQDGTSSNLPTNRRTKFPEWRKHIGMSFHVNKISQSSIGHYAELSLMSWSWKSQNVPLSSLEGQKLPISFVIADTTDYQLFWSWARNSRRSTLSTSFHFRCWPFPSSKHYSSPSQSQILQDRHLKFISNWGCGQIYCCMGPRNKSSSWWCNQLCWCWYSCQDYWCARRTPFSGPLGFCIGCQLDRILQLDKISVEASRQGRAGGGCRWRERCCYFRVKCCRCETSTSLLTHLLLTLNCSTRVNQAKPPTLQLRARSDRWLFLWHAIWLGIPSASWLSLQVSSTVTWPHISQAKHEKAWRMVELYIQGGSVNLQSLQKLSDGCWIVHM